MKLSRYSLIILILNIFILPLLGNNDLITLLGLDIFKNVANYLLPSLLVITLLIDVYKNKYIFKINTNMILFFIYLISLIISMIFAITYKGYTVTNLFKFISMIVIFLILSLFDLKEHEKFINRTIIILSIIICLFGISQYIFRFNLTLNGVEKYPGSIGRIKSTFLIATIFDKFLSFIIIYLLYLLYNKKDNIYLLIFTLILNFISLCLTYSRTGVIISIISIIIFTIYIIIKKQFKLIYVIILFSSIVLLIPGELYVIRSITDVIYDKISTNTIFVDADKIDIELYNHPDSSSISRDYFKLIAKKLMFKYPITGIGIGNYNYIYNEQNADIYLNEEVALSNYLYPHHMYYQLGAEIGIIGLISFYAIIIYNLLKKKNIFSTLFIITILISSLAETIFYIKDISYFIIILISIIPYEKR